MSFVSIGIAVGTTATSMIAGGVAKKKAKKANAKSEKEIAARTAQQSTSLQKGIDANVQAEKDISNEYAGQAVISPETVYARNQSERATASAIDRATRSGASATEIMNMVSGLTAKGQDQAQKISAAEGERRKGAMIASKTHAARAAKEGLAGTEAQIALQDKGYNMTAQKQVQNNQTASQNYDFFTGALGDLASTSAYAIANDKFAKSGVNTDGTTTGIKSPPNWFQRKAINRTAKTPG